MQDRALDPLLHKLGLLGKVLRNPKTKLSGQTKPVGRKCADDLPCSFCENEEGCQLIVPLNVAKHLGRAYGDFIGRNCTLDIDKNTLKVVVLYVRLV